MSRDQKDADKNVVEEVKAWEPPVEANANTNIKVEDFKSEKITKDSEDMERKLEKLVAVHTEKMERSTKSTEQTKKFYEVRQEQVQKELEVLEALLEAAETE